MTGPSFFTPNYGLESPSPSSGFTLYGSVRPPTATPDASPRGEQGSNSDQANVPLPRRCACTENRSIPPAPAVTLTPPSPDHPISAPPSYATPSPPKYALLATDTETALLLAPPPSFDESTRCAQCIENAWPCSRCKPGKADWVVSLLIVLNLVVWSAVIWGYVSQWRDANGIDWNRGGTIVPEHGGSLVDWSHMSRDPARCARITSAGEECDWAFADC